MSFLKSMLIGGGPVNAAVRRARKRMQPPAFAKQPKVLATLVALPILLAIANAQSNHQLVDVGPLLYPAGIVVTTQQGWPFHFLVVDKYSDRMLPKAGTTTRTINFMSLAFNTAAWLLLAGCPTYMTWSIAEKKWQMSIVRVLGLMTAVAVLLCGFRMQYQSEIASAAGLFGDSPESRAFLVMTSENALIRVMTFSVLCKTGIFLGMLCVLACAVDLALTTVRFTAKFATRRTKRCTQVADRPRI